MQRLKQGNLILSSGDSRYIAPLSKAAVAIGVDALFIESHPDPSSAISDGDNCMNIMDIENLIQEIIDIDDIARKSKQDNKMIKINKTIGRQIIDSRGNPTCEADVILTRYYRERCCTVRRINW